MAGFRDIFLLRGNEIRPAFVCPVRICRAGTNVQPDPVHSGMAMASGGRGSGPGAGFDQHGRSCSAARNEPGFLRHREPSGDGRRRWFRHLTFAPVMRPYFSSGGRTAWRSLSTLGDLKGSRSQVSHTYCLCLFLKTKVIRCPHMGQTEGSSEVISRSAWTRREHNTLSHR